MSTRTIVEAVKTIRDFAVEPLTPTIPARLPWMPRPKRNACWLLREMRDIYSRDPDVWTRGDFHDKEDRFCVVGLAYHVAGNRALAHQALRYLGAATGHNGVLGGAFREWNIAMWNDGAYSVDEIIGALIHAEDLAERAGACEP